MTRRSDLDPAIGLAAGLVLSATLMILGWIAVVAAIYVWETLP